MKLIHQLVCKAQSTFLKIQNCLNTKVSHRPHANSWLEQLETRVMLSADVLSGVINLAEIQTGAVNGTTFYGEIQGQFSGTSVSPAGDVNGDGIEDFLIGAPGPQYDAGQTYLIYGQQGEFPDYQYLSNVGTESLPGAVFIGTSDDDLLGYRVASAGDVNDDGFDDLVIGAYQENTYTGAAYLVYGHATNLSGDINLSDIDAGTLDGAVFRGINIFDYAGIAVTGGGDINNDGYDDIAIGAYSTEINGGTSGSVYVIYGGSTNFSGAYSLANVGTTINGVTLNGSIGHGLGTYLSFAGDLNGDDYDDLLIGAPYANNNAGISFLVYGRDAENLNGSHNIGTLGQTIQFNGPTDQEDQASGPFAPVGDVNGDGYQDFLISAMTAPDGDRYGTVYLIFGGTEWSVNNDLSKVGNEIPGATFHGNEMGAYAGHAVAAAGDINHDGYDDFLIGQTYGDSAGQAFLIYGAPTLAGSHDLSEITNGTLYGAEFSGVDANDHAGYSVSAADINNDGYNDIIIGAADATQIRYKAGEVYVVYGHSTSIGNYVFHDLNGNGVLDPNTEWGLPVNVTVNLLDADGGFLATTVTNANGYYAFDQLDAGDYIVEFITPENYVLTTKDAGSDDTIDSDADPTTHRTDVITLELGQANSDIDAGMHWGSSTIEEVYVFHNHSVYDNNTPGNHAEDDNAIDTGRQALDAGSTGAGINFTSKMYGLNGIMIDASQLPSTELSADDFVFKVGNDNDPDSWQNAPAPTSITVRTAAGVDGSDRITIIWDDEAITDQWLQVTILADGLVNPQTDYVFYFGNCIGDVNEDGLVGIDDIFDIWNNRLTPSGGTNATADNLCDINGDGWVDIADVFAAWNNRKSAGSGNGLAMIQPPIDNAQPSQLAVSQLAQALACTACSYSLTIVQSDQTHYTLIEVDEQTNLPEV